MKTFLRVFSFVRPYLPLFVGLFLANIALGAFGALTMAVIKPVMSELFDESRTADAVIPAANGLQAAKDSFFKAVDALLAAPTPGERLFHLSLLIVALFVLKNLVKYWSGVSYARLSELISRDMRALVFQRLLRQPLSFFNQNKSGELMALVTNEINTMHGSIVPFFMQLLRNPIEVLLLLTLLLSMSMKLSLIAMSTSVVTLVVIRVARKYLRRYATRMADSTAGYIGTLQEAVSAIRIVKAFRAESKVSNRFFDHATAYVRSSVKLAKINEAIPSVNEVFAISALAVVLYVGGHEVFAGHMRGSDLMTFLFALFAIMSPTVSLVSVPGQIQRGLVAAERVFNLVDLQPSLIEGSEKCPPFHKVLRFENLSFHYHTGIDVLQDVNFDLPIGKKIALVGASGSGKSTLIDLLVRFYDPTKGRVLLDGQDIRGFDTNSYRERFGIVSQDAVLFNDTIANNIAFSRESCSREEIHEAARIAHADSFIADLPQGYDTMVGDRGVLLSGGQRQRIAIARAIAMNPDILVFDEATSALDSESEKIVQLAITDVLKNRTAVIIAHRLSTIIGCDHILVFDKGRIVEQGTHSELLDLNGHYKHLYDLQFSKHEEEQHEGR